MVVVTNTYVHLKTASTEVATSWRRGKICKTMTCNSRITFALASHACRPCVCGGGVTTYTLHTCMMSLQKQHHASPLYGFRMMRSEKHITPTPHTTCTSTQQRLTQTHANKFLQAAAAATIPTTMSERSYNKVAGTPSISGCLR